jgi:quercetin dioxygenase-like cupin family protein
MVVTFDLRGPCSADASFNAEVLFEKAAMKIRRINLGTGARIPPCQMQEDVVFVVVAGRVTFRTDTDEALMVSPGAVFIPGGATTRSMEALEASVVLAVLCIADRDQVLGATIEDRS